MKLKTILLTAAVTAVTAVSAVTALADGVSYVQNNPYNMMTTNTSYVTVRSDGAAVITGNVYKTYHTTWFGINKYYSIDNYVTLSQSGESYVEPDLSTTTSEDKITGGYIKVGTTGAYIPIVTTSTITDVSGSLTSDSFIIDHDKLTISGAEGLTLSEIKAKLPSTYGYYLVTHDNVMKTTGTAEAGDKLWICDTSMNYKTSYTITTNIQLSYSDDKSELYATAATAAKAEDKIFIARHSGEGRLVNAAFADSSKNSGTATMQLGSDSTETTKVMLFNGWDKLNPQVSPINIGGRTLLNLTFEDDKTFAINNNDSSNMGVITDTATEGEPNVYQIARTDGSTTDLQAQISFSPATTDYVVHEFDLKVNSSDTYLRAYLMQDNGEGGHTDEIMAGLNLSTAYSDTMHLGTSSSLRHSSARATYTTGTWFRVTMVVNYHDMVQTTYIDGEPVIIDAPLTITDKATMLRFHSMNDSRPVNVYIDNVRVYESAEPLDDIPEFEKVVDISTDKTVYESEASVISELSGYSAVHSRSGVIYVNGAKSLLTNKPYIENGVTYVDADEVSSKLGVSTPDGMSGYVSLAELVSAMGKTLYTDTTAVNSGMNIIGDDMFSTSNVQTVNNYLFYLRPTKAQLKTAYESSPQYGVHPRIQATKADFDRIRKEYESGTNTYFMSWANRIINHANSLASGSQHITHTLSDGVRLTNSCRNMLDEMYVLGMAYQITGDTSYVNHAWTELEAVSNFADWNPGHHLDPSEMGFAVSIGYDWMYEALTDAQRETIERGIYNNLFYNAAIAYKTESSTMTNFATSTNNHNIVCNGGAAIAAMAMLDAYPNESYYILGNAIRGTDLMLNKWAPDGSWYEGVGYWELTMQYTAGLLSTMETALNTTLALETCDGLDTSADFMIYMQTQNGMYNTGDCSQVEMYVPEMLYLSGKYDVPQATSAVLKYKGTDLTYNNAYVGDNALGLIWYDTDNTDLDIGYDLDVCYTGDMMVSMRNNWAQDTTSTFAGMHGGITNADHSQLDGGSFVFEKYGIRWAKELGMGDYNTTGYWETSWSDSVTNRWNYFRSKAVSHNTIAINPGAEPEHNLNSTVDITRFENNSESAITVMDMSDALQDNATAAKRGFFYTDDRESLVIRDEITLSAESDVYWYMLTDAEVSIDGTRVTLTQDGKTLYLDVAAEGGTAEITYDSISNVKESLISDGTVLLEDVSADEIDADTGNRIAIKLTGSGSVSITVKLSDGTGKAVSEYGSIDSWTLDSGIMDAWKNGSASRVYTSIKYDDFEDADIAFD